MKTMMKIIAKLTLQASEAKGGVTNLLVLFILSRTKACNLRGNDDV